MIRSISFEGLVALIGWPFDAIKWFEQRFYAAEFDPMYGVVTLRHNHPDCQCKGTLRWHLDNFKMTADDPPVIPAFQEMIDDAREFYLAEHTKAGCHP